MTVANWVLADAVGALQDIVATLEAIASSASLDAAKAAAFSLLVATGPAPSASLPAATSKVVGLSNCAAALYAATPWLVSSRNGVDPSLGPSLIALARGLGAAMDPAAAAAAFAQALDLSPDPPPPLTQTASRLADAANLALIARFSRMVYAAPYAEALTATTYATREEAIQARADCAFRFERELSLCQGARDLDMASALTALRDAAAAYLTQAIINSAPVVAVSGPVLPALWWAWRLYQDPTRAGELLARNAVPTPEFMPGAFEALAA